MPTRILVDPMCPSDRTTRRTETGPNLRCGSCRMILAKLANTIYLQSHSLRQAPGTAPTAPDPLFQEPAMPTSPVLWKSFLVFLGPLIFSNMLQSLSGTINNIYVGQMIGVRALAAVSAVFPVLFLFVSFFIGLGSGAALLIGQAWGAKELDLVKGIAGTVLTVTITAGIAVAIVGGTFTQAALIFLSTPPDILADATAYARVVMISTPIMFTFLLVTTMITGVGDTVTPLLALLLSTAVGLLITPALIQGWFGLPALGVTSGAYAAIVSVVLALAWIALRLRLRGHPLAPDAAFARHLRIDWKTLGTVLRIGIPTGVQLIIISLAEIVLISLVNRFGSNATAAYGAVNQVMSYVQFPALSIAITASIIGAQTIGAAHPERLGAILRIGLLFNVMITGSLIALAYLFSRTILGFFITDGKVIELAQSLLHITLWSCILFAFASLLASIMRASGTVLAPTGIAIFAILFVEVPAAYLLSSRIGINGIWTAYPIAFTAMLAVQSAYYGLVWRKKQINRLI